LRICQQEEKSDSTGKERAGSQGVNKHMGARAHTPLAMRTAARVRFLAHNS
jgi:hypothetical protein